MCARPLSYVALVFSFTAAAARADQGIGGVSDFAATHVFPPLLRLRETVDVVQPESHTRRLNAVLKSAHLLPYYRTKQVCACVKWVGG